MVIKKFGIYGDNIIECKKALSLIAQSFGANEFQLVDSPIFSPTFIHEEGGVRFEFQLFSGHERWGFHLGNYLMNQGAILREAVDALITRIDFDSDKPTEEPILAMEFCGALAAGNNAWQRTGRALSMAYAKIPFLYVTEVGGVELDSSRRIKAPRFPNPAVPFSFVSLGIMEDVVSLPIYEPSPSISAKLLGDFHTIFSDDDFLGFIKGIISEKLTSTYTNSLQDKAIEMVSLLASQRSQSDKLTSQDWKNLFEITNGNERARFLTKSQLSWKKSITINNRTKSIDELSGIVRDLKASGAGSTNFPICVISESQREKFAEKMKVLYKNKVSEDFLQWIADDGNPLVIVWITGFKPRGDDSRPDRGLVPMARMMFGRNIQILTVVYGPAKTRTWDILQDNLQELASSNGLWESILHLSDRLLVDSATATELRQIDFICDIRKEVNPDLKLFSGMKIPKFGEHDVDTVLHMIFSQNNTLDFFECMCNPPGGDWSGISFLDINQGVEFRWTSLPRVSGEESKRPDHILQFMEEKVLLSVESKNNYSNLDKNIGPRLKTYVEDLLGKHAPISYKQVSGHNWEIYDNDMQYSHDYKTLSAVAFKYDTDSQLKNSFKEHGTDLAFAVEFNEYKTTLYVIYNSKTSFIKKYLDRANSIFGDYLKIVYMND